MGLLSLGLIIVLIVVVFDNRKKRKTIQNTPVEIVEEPKIEVTENLPYKKKLLLTKNEWAFYKSLKPIADELGYSVLAKIRVADLVEVNVKESKDFMKYFNKINKKHVDFILAKPENLQIELLIELDDNSHNSAQKQRDDFVEALYKQTGYKLLRVKGAADLKEKIMECTNKNQSEEDQSGDGSVIES